MYRCGRLNQLSDFFKDISQREKGIIYRYRIEEYNQDIFEFLKRYFDEAYKSGAVLGDGITNPTEQNLDYFYNIHGNEFENSIDFFEKKLKIWLPRLNDYQKDILAQSIYDELMGLKKSGKNDNMLKNAYIKFMCWLYYKFEKVVNQSSSSFIPKILYMGNMSKHEMQFLSMISKIGCDIVLVFTDKGQSYKKVDSNNVFSTKFEVLNGGEFPSDFSVKKLAEKPVVNVSKNQPVNRANQPVNRANQPVNRANQPVNRANQPVNRANQPVNRANQPVNRTSHPTAPTRRLESGFISAINTWIEGKDITDILTPYSQRGNEEKFIYTSFIRVNGVEDRQTYPNELYRFIEQLRQNDRKFVIIENEIPKPTVQEISNIRRGNYTDVARMLNELSKNINYATSVQLQKIVTVEFINFFLDEGEKMGNNVNKLMNKAVYILCWLKKYGDILFHDWKKENIGCVIYLGGCKDENEDTFLRFLSRLPLDILILVPNLNQKCLLTDEKLYEINYSQSMELNEFPKTSSGLTMNTVAFNAERDLDTIMYQDSGMYRINQFKKANVVFLRTMFEEIEILWDEALKFRPGFETINDTVIMPVISAKVSGVKDRNVRDYLALVNKLKAAPRTLVIQNVDYIPQGMRNPMKEYATSFYKNGRLLKEKIKSHPAYKFRILREEMQDYMLEKLQSLIEQCIIRGTKQNGTEYTIISVALNLNNEIIRMLQEFDFTGKNPKVIYFNTKDRPCSLEDTILLAYLNMLGFDTVFFVPTGYQCIEGYLNKKYFEEYQVGEFMFDLATNHVDSMFSSITNKIFRR
ncbi:YceG family protein [Lachnobacterium bovis]|uniref:Putative component of 'biosynthetic module n=1 Tax=Lachnobacterium bovis DSM 14045 TaxID=1122142 RepID=A0A1H3HAV9_9FIRM|nr:YceG family protein [Lachnobacterium bovis]SDY12345.1 Putative component of 'biosynthetic module' [Lachnobacterium bovis DSM 14045]